MYGFILMARGKKLEFYSVSQIETDLWIEALKSFVVLLDLKEEFTILDLLGKGNSAKVHKCVRKNAENPDCKFAMKTVAKSYIKQNKQNTVSNY